MYQTVPTSGVLGASMVTRAVLSPCPGSVAEVVPPPAGADVAPIFRPAIPVTEATTGAVAAEVAEAADSTLFSVNAALPVATMLSPLRTAP
jgi:hypothetical protein